ncbi:hypothetical protein NQ315_017356, partial [Exocentrus adspersus]
YFIDREPAHLFLDKTIWRLEKGTKVTDRYRTSTRSRKIVLFLNVPFPTMLEIFLHSFPTNKKLPRKKI